MAGETDFAIGSIHDIDDDRFKIGSFGGVTDRVRIETIADAAMHMKTHEIAPRIIASTDQPHYADSLQAVDVQPIGGMNRAVEKLEEWAAEAAPSTPFPNLAYEAIKAGLLKEEATRVQLNNHIAQIKECQKKIDLLLQLNSEFVSLGEKGGELSDRAMNTIAELKEKGIDVKIDGKKVSKEKAQEAKSLANSFIDQNRTKVQTSITIDVQTGINNDNTMVQILQSLVREYTSLVRKINENTGRQ